MKNKKTNYILIPVVLIIWGFLIYKVIDAFTDEPTRDLPVNKYEEEAGVIELENNKTAYALIPIDRDPFLGHSYVPKKTTRKPPKKTTKIEWPEVIFKGGVASVSNSSKIFVLRIDGQEYVSKIGQQVQGVSLIDYSNNKLHLRYKGEKRSFGSE